jgi:serine/threonine protein kinase
MNTFTYVQSRFYRAPEVVLGIQYDQQIDMWSLGCVVAELYCGRPIFPAIDEHELLEFHTLMCGNPPSNMIDKGRNKHNFFKINEKYKLIRSKQSRLGNLSKNSASLYQVLFRGRFPETMKNTEIHEKLSSQEKLMVDFIKRCLQIDPTKRITC